MKKRLFILMFALACVCGTRLSAQTTEGKDFWVALTYASQPKAEFSNVSSVKPYICISAQKKCQATITNPNTTFTTTVNINAGEWKEIQIPIEEWVPCNSSNIPQPYATVNDKTYSTGLHITADEFVSVFAADLYDKSFDASMILPTKVLGTKYIAQDYPAFDHENTGETNPKNTSYTTMSILATQNNTQVTITPKNPTYNNGHAAGGAYTKTLNAGEVYYIMSAYRSSLAGTVVTSDKPIAMFNGNICTDIPGKISARDCLYEQAMPTAFWGNHFVVTRSLGKDANRVRVIVIENDTKIYVDGVLKATLDEGETYEFEMSGEDSNTHLGVATTNQSTLTNEGLAIPDVYLTTEAHYIETSCPAAVYCYDVGQKYTLKNGSRVVSSFEGDPSMVWISPMEQRINKITFGVCATNNTKIHNINIVCLTEDVDNVTLYANTSKTYTNLTFQTVPGNPDYSFCQQQLCNTSNSNVDKVYTLSCPSGIVAHVYGNGDQESYAYSVGSAAAKTSMTINDMMLQNDSVSTKRICINEDIRFESKFDASINQVLWDMGDGQTFTLDNAARFTYKYESPGIKQIQAIGSLTNICTGESYTDTIRVAIMLGRADTVRRGERLCVEDPASYTGKLNDTVTVDCDTVFVYHMELGQATSSEIERTARDGYKWHGETYYESGDYQYTTENYNGCDSVVTLHLTVEKCLHMKVGSPDYIVCADEEDVRFPYEIEQGDPSDAYLVINGTKYPLGYVMTGDNTGYLSCPMRYLKAGKYSTEIVVTDQSQLCNQILHFKVSFTVQYASSVFKQKWTNVLAVRDSAYNGGYNFVGFQWYCNGQPVPGATSPNYYTDTTLTEGDEWFVMLTRDDGVVLPSCPQIINFDHSQNPAPERVKESSDAKKAVEQQRLIIIRDEKRYDVFGRRIQ